MNNVPYFLEIPCCDVKWPDIAGRDDASTEKMFV